MQLTSVCTSLLATLLSFFLVYSVASAETIVINSTDRGWYTEEGFHNPNNPNYAVGDYSGASSNRDFRNFFVFDLAGVTQPIAAAKLTLSVPHTAFQLGPGYRSADPSELYELYNVVTPIETLLAGTGGVAAHTDLGRGPIYGNRTMTAADMADQVEITLNSSAIVALDAATGLFGIGGALTTLDGMTNIELVFGYTDFSDISQLILTLRHRCDQFARLQKSKVVVVASLPLFTKVAVQVHTFLYEQNGSLAD